MLFKKTESLTVKKNQFVDLVSEIRESQVLVANVEDGEKVKIEILNDIWNLKQDLFNIMYGFGKEYKNNEEIDQIIEDGELDSTEEIETEFRRVIFHEGQDEINYIIKSYFNNKEYVLLVKYSDDYKTRYYEIYSLENRYDFSENLCNILFKEIK